jgi:hypothetical protein
MSASKTNYVRRLSIFHEQVALGAGRAVFFFLFFFCLLDSHHRPDLEPDHAPLRRGNAAAARATAGKTRNLHQLALLLQRDHARHGLRVRARRHLLTLSTMKVVWAVERKFLQICNGNF